MCSMISAQCDRLRERATELRSLAPDPDVPYLVPSTKEIMALAMGSAASEMERAADTILELRDDLQRANAAVQDAEHDESVAWDTMHKAKAENAKLRKFASGMYGLLEMFDQLMGTDDDLGTPRPLLFGDGGSFRDVARELGVEVH